MLARDHDDAVVDHANAEPIAKRLEVDAPNVMANDLVNQRRMAKVHLCSGNGPEEVGGCRWRAITQPADRFVNVVGGFRKLDDAEAHSLMP
jgi:hypothetical protein